MLNLDACASFFIIKPEWPWRAVKKDEAEGLPWGVEYDWTQMQMHQTPYWPVRIPSLQPFAVKLCGSLWASQVWVIRAITHSHDWFLQGAILAILAASAARNACAAANAGKVSSDAMGTHPLSSTNMTS